MIAAGDRDMARDVRDGAADPLSFQMAVVDKVESAQPGELCGYEEGTADSLCILLLLGYSLQTSCGLLAVRWTGAH
jgi:hypothetical protein